MRLLRTVVGQLSVKAVTGQLSTKVVSGGGREAND